MPNLYVRSTALPDVCGRIDYISNPKRQEHLLAFCDSTAALLGGQFWEVLAEESQQAFEQHNQKSRFEKDPKTGELKETPLKCCQGRELQIALSNALLDRLEPGEIAQVLVDEFQEKLGLQVAVAIHKNKTESNLHAHVIFPERQLLDEPVVKIADRNLFYGADGRRVYKKSDILDENKQLLPGCRIIRKGEIYEQRYFSAANPEYSYKSWTADIKTNVILPLRNGKLRGDVEITEYDPSTGKLAQCHVGVFDRMDSKEAKDKAADIRKYNELVKEFNQMIDDRRITLDEALAVQFEVNRLAEKTATLEARMEEIKERELLQRQAEEREKEQKWYFRSGWLRDASSPYKIYRYDHEGRKRSTVELLLILAAVIIENERNKLAEAVPDESLAMEIHTRQNKKLQSMVDAIRVSREEDLHTIPEIEDRLQQVGAQLSLARAEAKRLASSAGKMTPIVRAIQDYDSLRDKCEKIYAMPETLDKSILLAQEAANLERYNQAKANMYRAGIAAPEARQAFLERHSLFDKKLQRANESVDQLKEQYRRLSKLKYSVEMAQVKQYCYDPDWEPEEVDRLKDVADRQTPASMLQHQADDAPDR